MNPSAAVARMELSRRMRRHECFVRMLASLGPTPTILDVGGTTDYWRHFRFPRGLAPRIVLFNMIPQESSELISLVGDARDLSRFADRQFDVVFSNSVIGHVGDLPSQAMMANEVQRVGRHFYLQTPNQSFPVDWRTLVPCFHYLPAKAQAWFLLRLRVGKYVRAVSPEQAWEWATRIRNLSRKEVEDLFPGATVLPERVLGFTKSFVVHNFAIEGRSRAFSATFG
jgi:SAM-dependent methyltransferase